MRIVIKQSLNQNAVISNDDKNEEFLLLEKGIGFNKKKGDIIKVTEKTKVIPINFTEQEQSIIQNLKELPNDLILVVEDTIKGAEKILGKELNTSSIFILSSHIYHALDREEEIDEVTLPFDYSLKYLFQEEYKAAKWSVEYLREKHNLQLPDSEIVFFTFHLVDALQSNSQPRAVMDIGNVLNDIVKILEQNTLIDVELDKDSINFSRFLIHIRYFLMRQNDKKQEDDMKKNLKFEPLYNKIASEFPKTYPIVEEVQRVLENKHEMIINYEENLYLLLHVQRLIEESYD